MFLGAGHVDAKIRFNVPEFIEKTGALLADLSS